MHFSLMNNTPVHFLLAGIMIVLFLVTTFKLEGEQRAKGLMAMHILFVPVLLSGCFIWTLVDFSLPLLIKSVGGLVLYWLMTQLVKDPSNRLYWYAGLGLLAVGGGLAITMI